MAAVRVAADALADPAVMGIAVELAAAPNPVRADKARVPLTAPLPHIPRHVVQFGHTPDERVLKSSFIPKCVLGSRVLSRLAFHPP